MSVDRLIVRCASRSEQWFALAVRKVSGTLGHVPPDPPTIETTDREDTMIHRATPADADALSVLSRTCFTQTFGHLYAPHDLALFLDQAYSPSVLHTELTDPAHATWLLFEESSDEAEDERCDRVTSGASPADAPSTRLDSARPEEEAHASSLQDPLIGYVTACPAHLPHPDVAPDDGEIQRLYILRGHQGEGHGTTLLRTALEWLERNGPRTVWIGVWSENYGAQRFYARHGFDIVGEYLFMVGDHADREFITRRPARGRPA